MNPKLLAAALTSLLFATTANAAGPVNSTTVNVSNVAISVFDLTPADGIAAGYTTRDTTARLVASIASTDWMRPVHGYASDSPTSANSLELEYRNEYASASWNGTFGGLSVAVTSTQSLIEAKATAGQSMVVTIAPHTGFVFSGVAAQSAVNPGVEAWSYRLTSDVSARIYDATDLDHELLFERQLGGENAADYAWTEPFSLTYVNDTDLSREVTLSIGTYAYAHAPLNIPAVSAVPEPSTYLMLGAGLLGICWRARRGQRA